MKHLKTVEIFLQLRYVEQNTARFKFSPTTTPAVYNVVLTFKDVNAGRSVEAVYPVTVSAA